MASSKKDTKPKAAPQKAAARASAGERAADAKPASAPAKKPSAPPASFRLFEWKPGNYSLTLRGPGYAWERVARKLARAEGLLERVRFDPEASVFSAFSTDREALQALQALLDPLLEDEEKLRALERAARVEGGLSRSRWRQRGRAGAGPSALAFALAPSSLGASLSLRSADSSQRIPCG